jgi:hypothetical protein
MPPTGSRRNDEPGPRNSESPGAERGARTSGGAEISTETFSPRHDRDSEGQRRFSQDHVKLAGEGAGKPVASVAGDDP